MAAFEKLVGIYIKGYAASGIVDPVRPAPTLVVVAVVGKRKSEVVEVVVESPPPLPPVLVAPSVPVHFAPVGQQAMSFAESTVHVVPDSQQIPELPSFEQLL